MKIIKRTKKIIGDLFSNTQEQINQKRKIGIEIEEILFDSKNQQVRHFSSVNPLDKLRQKSIITDKECEAGKQYQQDYELANQSRISHMSYDSIMTSGGKTRATEIKEKQMRASENVYLIRKLITEKEGAYKKFCEAKGGRNRAAGYLEILEMLIEREMSIGFVRIKLGFHPETKNVVEKKSKIVFMILDNYYNN